VENYNHRLVSLILDASSVNDWDSSADKKLHKIAQDYRRRNITFYIAGGKGLVRDVMKW